MVAFEFLSSNCNNLKEVATHSFELPTRWSLTGTERSLLYSFRHFPVPQIRHPLSHNYKVNMGNYSLKLRNYGKPTYFMFYQDRLNWGKISC